MSYTVVEQYLHYGIPVRTPEQTLDGAQYDREPGWELVRQYFAWYVPEADLQTYIDKIEDIATEDFVLQGEPAVDPMHGLRNGYFFVRGSATKRMTAQPEPGDHDHSPSYFKFYGIAIMEDDFASFDAAKWDLGTNAGNSTAATGGVLICASTDGSYGWVSTVEANPLDGAFIDVDVRKHNVGGVIQFSPTKNVSYSTGFRAEADWYEVRLGGTPSVPTVAVFKREGGGGVSAVSGDLTGLLGVYTLTFSVIGGEIRLSVINDITAQAGGPFPPVELWLGTWNLGAIPAASDFYIALGAEDSSTNGETWFDNFALKG